jgi:zinc D-Ala-D-Ala carboxypeptidase
MSDPMQLSEHFTLAELTFSQVALRQGFPNSPSSAQLSNLIQLCEQLLEPGRTLLDVPLHVDSGYRSPVVNEIVGGAHTSAHIDGRAADFITIGMPLRNAFEKLRASELPYDQLIIEANAWLHIAIAPSGTPPRREALLASGGPGAWHYAPAGGTPT